MSNTTPSYNILLYDPSNYNETYYSYVVGKAINLFRINSIVEVPNFFCISSKIYDSYINNINQTANKNLRDILPSRLLNELERRYLILVNYSNQLVAVRSSSTLEDGKN